MNFDSLPVDLQSLSVAFLVTVAAGGIAWVLLNPLFSGERQAEQRRQSIAASTPASRRAAGRAAAKPRRDQIEETLKDLERRSRKASSIPLGTRIQRAGLKWSKQRFCILSGLLGVFVVLLALGFGGGIVVAGPLGFAAALGVPRWALKFLARRREKKFIEHFPDAVDVIVRGIKAGLPLLDSIKVITNDSPEPIRGEFRAILETQAIGMPIGEACLKLYERIPLPEANFFGIVISIQQKSGGNLSETLGNLSRVLRDRKKMKAKINAMSMEAKASASIIGALPICVMGLVYITSPDYISLLWTHSMGHIMLAGSALWMTAGVLVMRKMINFDF